MAAGDLDHDGVNELIVSYGDVATATIHRVVTYRWYAGDFRELSTIELGNLDAIIFVFLEDTDTDGQLELITVEGAGDAGTPLIIHEWDGTTWTADWTYNFTAIRRSNSRSSVWIPKELSAFSSARC